MINQAFAEQFIRRIRSQTDYNINIMNEHGIIIASCSEERVGTFHATAFRMITNNISINVTEDRCTTTNSSVNSSPLPPPAP